MLRHAVRLNSLTELALTKLDVLDGFDDREGVHRLPHRRQRPSPAYPDRSDVLARVEPVVRHAARLGRRARAAREVGRSACRRPTALIELVEREVGIPCASSASAPSATTTSLVSLTRSVIDRYSLPEMEAVWRDTARFGRWLEVELLAMEAHAALGVVPAEHAAACRARAPTVDDEFVAAVVERERTTDHDVAAFVDVVQERIGMPAGAWIHYGLTSSDVVDTALCWAMRDALDVVLDATGTLLVDARRSGPPPPPHRDDRAHARHPRRADDVRRQGRAVGAAVGA